jgi:hypothetical protein
LTTPGDEQATSLVVLTRRLRDELLGAYDLQVIQQLVIQMLKTEPIGVSHVLTYIGQAAYDLDDNSGYGKSLGHLQKARSVARTIMDRSWLVVTLVLEADVLRLMHRLPEAEAQLALAQRQTGDDVRLKALVEVFRGRVFLSRNDYEQAYKQFDMAHELIGLLGNNPLLIAVVSLHYAIGLELKMNQLANIPLDKRGWDTLLVAWVDAETAAAEVLHPWVQAGGEHVSQLLRAMRYDQAPAGIVFHILRALGI